MNCPHFSTHWENSDIKHLVDTLYDSHYASIIYLLVWMTQFFSKQRSRLILVSSEISKRIPVKWGIYFGYQNFLLWWHIKIYNMIISNSCQFGANDSFFLLFLYLLMEVSMLSKNDVFLNEVMSEIMIFIHIMLSKISPDTTINSLWIFYNLENRPPYTLWIDINPDLSLL